ncbi:MAG TPA: hypothetical protein VJ202_03360 [Thermodesulfobacteriota bacterium]|nr:hypothetical protein [Thermodesulfobacteriota bacterium]
MNCPYVLTAEDYSLRIDSMAGKGVRETRTLRIDLHAQPLFQPLHPAPCRGY